MQRFLNSERVVIRELHRCSMSGLLVLFVLAAACSITRAQEPSVDLFYYNGEQKIGLKVSGSFVAAHIQKGGHFQPSASVSERLAADEVQDLHINNLKLYRLRDTVDDKGQQAQLDGQQLENLRGELAASPGVGFVAQVFQTRNALMIVSDEFLVQFAKGISRNVIDGINGGNGVEIVRQLNWSPNTFLLRVIDGDCLQMANDYHEMEDVLYSHPNFVRVMDKMRPGGSISKPHLSFDRTPQVVTTAPLAASEVAADNDYPQASSISAALPPVVPAPAAPVVRTTILSTDFDEGGTWSGITPWLMSGNPQWDDASIDQGDGSRVYSGSWSGYCVDGGLNRVLPRGPYPNDVDSRMTYGPFDLSDAEAARLSFRTWVQTQYRDDYLHVLVSTDGINFNSGNSLSGDWAAETGGSGYMHWAHDLRDFLGEGNVWVQFRFTSDASIVFEGVYIDDIVIEKITGGYENLTSDEYDHLQWGLENNGQLWGVEGVDIGARAAWKLSEGRGVVIAIIDEGVDLGHPDLKLVPGYDATGDGSAGHPSWDDAHGTNCAGIAAAITDNGQGVAGVAGKAAVMPIRIARGSITGWVTSDAWISDGLIWAVDHGADVLNNSWGGGTPSAVIDSALTYARTNGRGGKGCLVVFATGNDNGPVSYPATNPDVLAVGALSPCDEPTYPDSCDGEFWWGSNLGTQLDISAPGVHMYSTDIQGAAGYSPGDYYHDFNGTSSAAPVVSGVGAQILSMCPNLNVGDVEEILKQTADDITPFAPSWGQIIKIRRVNAHEALKYAEQNYRCGFPWPIFLPSISVDQLK